MEKNKIYLTEEGYKQYEEKIASLNLKIKKNNLLKADAYTSATGDGWHDNFAFEEASREEDSLLTQVEDLIKMRKNIEIIKQKKVPENLVNINDVVIIEFIYNKEDREIEKIKLTGNWETRLSENIQEISLNSPLGQAIYLKEINSKIQYTVNGKTVDVQIINKIS